MPNHFAHQLPAGTILCKPYTAMSKHHALDSICLSAHACCSACCLSLAPCSRLSSGHLAQLSRLWSRLLPTCLALPAIQPFRC
ncbi:hypothetical protein K466DRAFT_585087 [Polyporus arcularius HHB13444]|uniref:Uncharacterized protein n=1 Tax=Polyporus arcularius HHB13444 TaxID=1314778 RepID=A0A5C3PHY8_9APHY|nr:hypothetical protein K466DRAFT_585087 [Polyporus arcularius HHB13444]